MKSCRPFYEGSRKIDNNRQISRRDQVELQGAFFVRLAKQLQSDVSSRGYDIGQLCISAQIPP